MFLLVAVIVVPSVVALGAQFVCYQQYLGVKPSFSAAYVPA